MPSETLFVDVPRTVIRDARVWAERDPSPAGTVRFIGATHFWDEDTGEPIFRFFFDAPRSGRRQTDGFLDGIQRDEGVRRSGDARLFSMRIDGLFYWLFGWPVMDHRLPEDATFQFVDVFENTVELRTRSDVTERKFGRIGPMVGWRQNSISTADILSLVTGGYSRHSIAPGVCSQVTAESTILHIFTEDTTINFGSIYASDRTIRQEPVPPVVNFQIRVPIVHLAGLVQGTARLVYRADVPDDTVPGRVAVDWHSRDVVLNCLSHSLPRASRDSDGTTVLPERSPVIVTRCPVCGEEIRERALFQSTFFGCLC